MPIDSTHPMYDKYRQDWENSRDAVGGQRAIKAKGTRYLPRLSGQDDDEYKAYKERALFYSITSKTLAALVGMITEKPPTTEYPDAMRPYFDDDYGHQFTELVSTAASELMLVSRIGLLVDRPVDGGKPYVSVYTTENIINWETDASGNLTWVVLKEEYWAEGNDRYERCLKTRYRELSIVDGRLEVKLFEDSNGVYTAQSPTTITNTGRVMDKIPFICATSIGLGIDPVKPTMSDIVDINISHYRTSADLEHGRHFTGLPTPYITGGETNKVLKIGSTAAWIIPDPSAKVGFLEFTGQGLQSLEKALTEKQGQLASMSARMIDNSSRGSEAAETVRLRYMSEVSGLKVTAGVVQALLNATYQLIASMESIDSSSVKIKMNTDFLESAMSAAELKAWFEVYQSGGISKDVFVYALRKGQKIDNSITSADFPDLPKTELTSGE